VFDIIALGGGCFWCTEAVFSMVHGVIDVEPGYSGGTTVNPTYEEVCSDKTGHAEVVRIAYDPDTVSLIDLLEIFFKMHDPTQGNRQGEDVGSQYRSIILYTSDEQAKIIEDYINHIQGHFKRPITTEVRRLEAFYSAEKYHRGYYQVNGAKPYCRLIIAPKVEKIRNEFRKLMR
jgi:peptide-methionine (S)-S-oxide reductase